VQQTIGSFGFNKSQKTHFNKCACVCERERERVSWDWGTSMYARQSGATTFIY
jgi:hypothetical protein